ncbi:LpxI family protein [Salipiger sp. IMCC34102]|uniref:LpxI family protein n=1 Tax=Salipiger sp. IMCC34102 TaxID=2510647 RepID=UPI00101B6941|nr:UDP-2,3-diacylglucosamine diphosphatase LpxI [Salipiger sp. IMCC34102]RYH03417.1 LpxI family protein [Salipiger sp. IMCC34102]
MTLALIAGEGDLPPALVGELAAPPLVCALEGVSPRLPVDLWFRLERLAEFMAALKARGITQVCMAGGLARPNISWRAFGLSTLPLVPVMLRALRRGDDGALRAFIGVMEARGLQIVAAQDIAPDLLPPHDVLTKAAPTPEEVDLARLGDACLADMGRRDTGQACVLRDGQVAAEEDRAGTDALIRRAAGAGGLLFKGPKPGQDRRADLPVIGPGTAEGIIAAGLDGIVIAAGGVMVLDRAATLATLDAAGKFLWVRTAGT